MTMEDVVRTANDKFHPLLNQALQDVGLCFVVENENRGAIQGAPLRCLHGACSACVGHTALRVWGAVCTAGLVLPPEKQK